MFSKFLNKLSYKVAIDLGTANLLVADSHQGIVINEPSIVAVNTQTKELLAAGHEAEQMLGRTPAHVVAVRPLKDGVIADYDAAEAMIKYALSRSQINNRKFYNLAFPRVVISVPTVINEVEARAVIEAAKSAGARDVYLIEEPIAAAIGAGLNIEKPLNYLLVDIGGGTTDIAIISMGGLTIDSTVKIAGDELSEAIISYVEYKYNLRIGESSASAVKIKLANLSSRAGNDSMAISGKDIATNLPKKIGLNQTEVKEAILPVIDEIQAAILEAIEQAPPQAIADVMENEMVLVGGGAKIEGISDYLADQLNLPVRKVDNPELAVINGAVKLLDNVDLLEKVRIKERRFD